MRITKNLIGIVLIIILAQTINAISQVEIESSTSKYFNIIEGTVLNPTNADDGNWSSFASMQGDPYGQPFDIAYYLNFSVDDSTILTANMTARGVQGIAGITAYYCWNVTNLSWIYLGTKTAEYDIIPLNESCFGNPTINLRINGTHHTAYYLRLYDVRINLSYDNNQTFTIKSELTNTHITTPTFTINRVINDLVWDQYNTTNGYVFATNINESGILDIEYYDTNDLYSKRHYYINNNADYSSNIDLYVTPKVNVTSVLFTLYRENGEVLPNYYVEVYKRWPNTNSYMLVEMHKTDFNGQALMNLQLIDATYKLKIRDPSFDIVYESDETSILSTSLSLTIQTIEDIWASLQNIDGIGANIEFLNSTSQFKFSWDDSESGIVDYLDFITIRRTMYGDTTICNNRTYETQGILYCTVNLNQSGTFVSHAYVETNTNHSYYPIFRISYNRPLAESKSKFGIVASILLIIGLGMLGLISPAIGIILALLGFIAVVILKLIAIQYGILVTIIIIGGIIAYKVKY